MAIALLVAPANATPAPPTLVDANGKGTAIYTAPPQHHLAPSMASTGLGMSTGRTSPAVLHLPASWQQTTLSPLNKTWGEADGAIVKVSPDGSRAIAYWTGYRVDLRQTVMQLATWTPGTGWRDTQSMSNQSGALAVNSDVATAAWVSTAAEGASASSGTVTLRVLDVATNTWTPPSEAAAQPTGYRSVACVRISDDGRTVLAGINQVNSADDTVAYSSIEWKNATDPVTAPMPGLNRSITLAPDGSSAFVAYPQGLEYSPTPITQGVFASRYKTGAWTPPEVVPVGDFKRISQEAPGLSAIANAGLTTIANADLSRIMLVWGDASDPYAQPTGLGTAYWENGSWRTGRTMRAGDDIQLAISANGDKLLVTYNKYKALTKFPFGRMTAAYRWWTPSHGWTGESTFPSAGSGRDTLASRPTLTPDGQHAAAVIGVGRWVNRKSQIIFRPTLWTGTRWTTAQPILPEQWSEVAYKQYGGGFVSLSGNGREGLFTSADSVGDYSTYSVAKWTVKSGWGGRTTVMVHEPHGSVSETAYSYDGRVSFTLVKALDGRRGLVAVGPSSP